MPLLGESCAAASDWKIFRRSPATVPPPPATSVRRCLFAADDETRRRTDQWLEHQLTAIKVDNRRKAAYWGFDFENDVPVDKVRNESGREKNAADFEWTALSADSVPSFYSRQVTHERICRLHDTTPAKPLRHRQQLQNATADLVCTLKPVLTGLLEALPAGWSETTPHKPPPGDAATKQQPDVPSTSTDGGDDGNNNNKVVYGHKRQGSQAFGRRKTNNLISSKFEDQSKLTNFYPLRKRIRRHDDHNHHFTAKLQSGHHHVTKSFIAAAPPPDDHQQHRRRQCVVASPVVDSLLVVLPSDGGHSPPMTSSSSTSPSSSSAVF